MAFVVTYRVVITCNDILFCEREHITIDEQAFPRLVALAPSNHLLDGPQHLDRAPVVSRVRNRGKQRQNVRRKHACNLVCTESRQHMFFHRTSKHPTTILSAFLTALLVDGREPRIEQIAERELRCRRFFNLGLTFTLIRFEIVHTARAYERIVAAAARASSSDSRPSVMMRPHALPSGLSCCLPLMLTRTSQVFEPSGPIRRNSPRPSERKYNFPVAFAASICLTVRAPMIAHL
ncbi:hypothetical protein BCO18430_06354 [Burkholderia contaminans]|nr:hypothetical protein BCO18430_06354 [Burkholderia contaminans]